jgi:hypothetical protein
MRSDKTKDISYNRHFGKIASLARAREEEPLLLGNFQIETLLASHLSQKTGKSPVAKAILQKLGAFWDKRDKHITSQNKW